MRRPGSGVILVLAACLQAAAASAQDDVQAVLARARAAWRAKDLAGYLQLWEFASPEARERETAFTSAHLAADETDLKLRLSGRQPEPDRLRASGQVFSVTEPRGRVEQWIFVLERRVAGIRIVGREPAGQLEGLVHLELDPAGWRADGIKLRLEDFELDLIRGTLFTTPPAVGRTALVFVGDATVVVRPRPDAEREQLRLFCGKPELRDRVHTVFIRMNPADVEGLLGAKPLVTDLDAAARLDTARRFWSEQVTKSYVLDTNLPRSPWWLIPSQGDASLTFDTGRRGLLSFNISNTEPEGISLIDREHRRQICLYPAAGHDTRYSEDSYRSFDVLRHDLKVRFEPRQAALRGEDTLRMRMLYPTGTVRLRLDDSLRVDSVSSAEAGDHLFFRVRGQDSVMVSLGPLLGAPEVTLTIRYQGVHRPDMVEHEVIQTSLPQVLRPDQDVFDRETENQVFLEPVLIYSNRTAWYPQGSTDDHALASVELDVPAEFMAVSGGVAGELSAEEGRRRVVFTQDQPGKYITAAVGRLVDVGVRQEGNLSIHGYSVARTRDQAKEALDLSLQILAFYQQEFGPCPYPALNLVVNESKVPGGHSPPGMVQLTLRPIILKGLLQDDPASFHDIPGFFLAHELAHQWWGHGVAGQNYRERWLGEGFAQYAAALWIQHNRGERAFHDVLDRLWRWSLRENQAGPISLGNRLGHVKNNPQVYRAIVYDKGAYVLHMMRGLIGAEAFRKGAAAFQAEHRFGKAGTDDLRQSFERASGLDLRAYFEQWVYSTTLPTLGLRYHARAAAGGYATEVKVSASALPGPMPLQITLLSGDKTEERIVRLEPAGGSWTFESAGEIRKVLINRDRGLLVNLREDK